MLQEQIFTYIRQNTMIIVLAAGGVAFLLLLVVLVQVTRTRREVHKICKKIRKYFDVIMSEDAKEEQKKEPQREADMQVPVYQQTKDWKKEQEEMKKEEDVKILMDVISEVF